MKLFKAALVVLALGGGVALPVATLAQSAMSGLSRSNPINLNRATQKELEKLPGIGPKIAKEIIKHRPYKDGKELQAKVKGIGPKVWADISPYVTFR